MALREKYELRTLLRDDGVRTYQAVERSTGQAREVHVLPVAVPADVRQLLPRARGRVEMIEAGDYFGMRYVVTKPLPSVGFREWLRTPPPAPLPEDPGAKVYCGQAFSSGQHAAPAAKPANGWAKALSFLNSRD
jgi:hypothetical protein